jgi:LacI family transcriptional regulator
VEAFAAAGRACRVFVGHDVDADNAALMRARRISAVLHHELRQDMRTACRHIMVAHGALPEFASGLSPVHVITPFNLPS